VEDIQKFPQAITIKDLQVLLGKVNCYRRFLLGIAYTLRPLTDALHGGPKGSKVVMYTKPMNIAFQVVKQALLDASCLAHPTMRVSIVLVVDTPATQVGAYLQKLLPGAKAWRPLGFSSKKLEDALEKYSAFDRELFTCCTRIRHFQFTLEGRKFSIFTDHKPLTFALGQVSGP
jgi:hypothetical protein